MTKENSQVDLLRNLITSNIEIQAMTAHSLIFNRLPAIASATVGKSLLVISFSFILYALSFTLFTSPAHAQTPCPTNLGGRNTTNNINTVAISSDVFDDKVFNFNQMIGTTDSIYTLLTGCSQLHPETNIATEGTGALAASGRLVASVYRSPPASGVDYFAKQIRKLNPVQPAYAQAGGIGFNALSPVQNVWSAMRNISYIGFTIVFIIIGFMIMFRARISPQAVATVQDSIPRITIALILVTFSYAIAGFLIDIMFLLLNLFINVLPSSIFSGADYVFTESIFGVIWGSWDGIFKTVASALANIIDAALDLPSIIDDFLGWLGGTLAAIVIAIALIFIMFRIFFMLLMAYVMIIVLTVFAPFLFLFQALPGNKGASTWFRQMAANIAVFPAVAIMLIFAGILGGISELGGIPGSSSAIGEAQIGQFPLIAGGIDTSAIGQLIAIGFILMTPGAAKMIKERIGIREGGIGFGAGAAALGAGAAALSRPAGLVAGPAVRAAQWKTGDWATRQIGRALPFGKKSGDQPDATTAIPPHQREHR